MTGAGLLFSVLWLRERHRTNAIRAMAMRSGFHYLGSALPNSLTLNGTPLENLTASWNVVDGERNGVRVIAFDCRIGHGKASWRRTVIAAESPLDTFGTVPFDHDLTVDRSGRWAVLYQPKTVSFIPPGFMSVPELEAHLGAINPDRLTSSK
jgi:hypothetical protein